MEALSCRLLPWEIADGPTNMAADEVMVRTAAEYGIASLRFYGWSPPTLSLGYFQPASARLGDAALAALPFVRRPSGGGAIVHHHEVTYALALPPGDAWQRGVPWMRRMHEIICGALRRRAHGPVMSLVREMSTIDAASALCFQHWTPGDVLCDGNKVVGSAQRKYCRALLQHGSILLARSDYAPALPGINVTLDSVLGPKLVCEVLANAVAAETGWDLLPSVWRSEEREAIAALAREKYGTADWNERR